MDDSKYPEDPADIQKGKALFDVASYSGSHSAGMDAVEWLKNNANAMFDEIKALREKTASIPYHHYPVDQKYRIVPKRLADQLPPHPIEFAKDDNDAGRSCMKCGFSVPSGYRHHHADWHASKD